MSKRPYSWHKEVYEKAMKDMATFTEKKENECDLSAGGWLDWFSENHQDLFNKYMDALQGICSLWGSMDPGDMEKFKTAVTIERDATKWAVQNYIEYQKRSAEETRLKMDHHQETIKLR